MSSRSERAALIARQGSGARYDAPEAPAHELLLARRGVSYFSRLLNELRDEALPSHSHFYAVSRAQLVAAVSYHARGLTRLLNTAPEHVSKAARRNEIELGRSLPPRALRGLFHHTSIHLDVTWRDLPGSAWSTVHVRHDQTTLIARETPRLRAKVIWTAALALNAGGRTQDNPFQSEDFEEVALELGLG